jgi:hypothetical protein
MATKEQIKAALLGAAGNPSSGAIVEIVDEMVQAIMALESKKASTPDVNVRIVESKETR